MTLQEYIKDTTVQIVNAINEANKELAASNSFVVGSNLRDCSDSRQPMLAAMDANGQEHFVTNIDFEVATTIEKSKETKTGGTLLVSVLSVGHSKSQEANDLFVNKVKFSIPVALPVPTNE